MSHYADVSIFFYNFFFKKNQDSNANLQRRRGKRLVKNILVQLLKDRVLDGEALTNQWGKLDYDKMKLVVL